MKTDISIASLVRVQKLELRATELLRKDKMQSMMSSWEEERGSKIQKIADSRNNLVRKYSRQQSYSDEAVGAL